MIFAEFVFFRAEIARRSSKPASVSMMRVLLWLISGRNHGVEVESDVTLCAKDCMNAGNMKQLCALAAAIVACNRVYLE